jgi:alcohol dehydrogenase class IV
VQQNLAALRERVPKSPAVDRYREIAQAVTGDGAARADDLVDWLRQLALDLRIPSLAALGVAPDSWREIAQKAANASSMKANPVSLTEAELMAILAQA